jgi:hypothetical protein
VAHSHINQYDSKFYKKSTKYVTNKELIHNFQNLLFYVVSDDPDWQTPSLKSSDIFFTKNSETPFQRGALLNDHTGFKCLLFPLVSSSMACFTYLIIYIWLLSVPLFHFIWLFLLYWKNCFITESIPSLRRGKGLLKQQVLEKGW